MDGFPRNACQHRQFDVLPRLPCNSRQRAACRLRVFVPLTMSQVLGASAALTTGCCPVCGATIKLVASSGAVYRHGHGHGRPACAGSGQPPVAPPPVILDASADLFDDPPDPPAQGGAVQQGFRIDAPIRPALRRIPQGARQRASQAFTTRLRALLS